MRHGYVYGIVMLLVLAGAGSLWPAPTAASLPTFTVCGVGLGTPSRINGAPVLWREYVCDDSDWGPAEDSPITFGDIALCGFVDSEVRGAVFALCQPVPGNATFCTFDYDRIYGQSILCNGLPDGGAIRERAAGEGRLQFCLVFQVTPPRRTDPIRATIACADTTTVLRALGW